MSVLLLMVVQAGAASGRDPLAGFDLAKVDDQPCAAAGGDGGGADVVVCGRRNTDRYRVPKLEDLPTAALPKAEVGLIGDVKGSATVERKEMPGGAVSNRVMLNVKLPF